MNRDLRGIGEFIRDKVSPPRSKANSISGVIKKKIEDSFSSQKKNEVDDSDFKVRNGFTDVGANKRTDPKLAYGGGKAPLPKDADNRVHSLERENLKLKSKESLLELEIRK